MAESSISRTQENLRLPESSWPYWFIAPLAGVSWGFFLIRLLKGYPLVLPHLTLALLTLLCGLLLGRRQWRGGREIYVLGLWGVVAIMTLSQCYTAGVAFLLFGLWLPGRKVSSLTAKLFFTALFAGCAAGYFMAGNGIIALAMVLVMDFVFNTPLQKKWKIAVPLLWVAVLGIFLCFSGRVGYLNAEKVTHTRVPPIALLCGIGCTDPDENVPRVVVVTADKVSDTRKNFLTGEPVGMSVEFADINISDADKSFGLVDVIAVEDFRSGSSEFASRILANMSRHTVLIAPESFARLAPQLKWYTLPGEGKDKFVIARRGTALRIEPEDIEKRLLAVSDNSLCPAGTFYGLMIGFQSSPLLPDNEEKTPHPAASRWWLLLLPFAVAVMELFSRRKKCDAAIVGCWESGFTLAILSVIYFSERGEMNSGSQILFLILSTFWLAVALPLRDLPLLILKIAAVAMALLGVCGYPAMIKGVFICAGMLLAAGNARVLPADQALKLPASLIGMICGLILTQGLLFWRAVNLLQLLAIVAALLIWSFRLLSFHGKRK